MIALLVIAAFCSRHLSPAPLIAAAAAFAAILATRALRTPHRRVTDVMLGVAVWGGLTAGGVDPVVAGLAIGLSTSADAPSRTDLERATGLVRLFREQPSPARARSATAGLASSLSANARLQHLYHPWTQYLIIPLFALANAGLAIDPGLLGRAVTAPVTVGIFLGYTVGKPLAIVGVCWALTRLSRGRLRPPVGWASVAGSGSIAGIGFTVSLLIATLAFRGPQFDEAKLGTLAAAAASSAAGWLVFRLTALLPAARRDRALLGTSPQPTDLLAAVHPGDHVRGAPGAAVTVVEYGDYERPYCSETDPVTRDLLMSRTDVRYVGRHLPLSDVHPHARLAAEAAEAAGAQGAFWPMHRLLLEHQDRLEMGDLLVYAAELGLDERRFRDELERGVHRGRVARDIASADLGGVSGTPAFFLNGRRHHGRHDLDALTRAIAQAGSGAQRAPQALHVPQNPRSLTGNMVLTG